MDVPDQEQEAMRLKEALISDSTGRDNVETSGKDELVPMCEPRDLNTASNTENKYSEQDKPQDSPDSPRNGEENISVEDASNFGNKTSGETSNPSNQEDLHGSLILSPTDHEASPQKNIFDKNTGDSSVTDSNALDGPCQTEEQLKSGDQPAESFSALETDTELPNDSTQQEVQCPNHSAINDHSETAGFQTSDEITAIGNQDGYQTSSTQATENSESDRLRSRKGARESSEMSSTSTADTSHKGSDNKKEEEDSSGQRLIYGLTDTPPLRYLVFFAIQQACLAISTPLGTTAIVSQAVCAKEDLELKVKILSSTMAMMGLSTFLMTTLGVKLPIFQGPAPGYIIPLIVLMSLPEFACPETFWATDPDTNTSVLMAVISGNSKESSTSVLKSAGNSSDEPGTTMSSVLSVDTAAVPNRDVSLDRLQAYAGSLMVAGTLHFLIGLTGIMGTLVRFVGPVTIVPVVLLFGIYIHTVVVMFSETNWIVAVITAGTCIVLGLFLADRKTPLPVWTPRKGFRVIWTSAHQIFAILIALILGWGVSFLMTVSGALSDDPNNVQFNARTDARDQVVAQTSWLILPYPGQFGAPGFSGTALITFLISTVISILDSIGDYYATARAARAPPPPSYALNRGVAVEGAMSILSGGFGCGQATVSYSENIGAIGLSRVASRSVFQIVGVIYMFLAVVGKVGAVFVSIPDAVIGGSQIVTFGILIGVILSYLQLVDLQRTRNVSIIGIAILLGMMLPHWVEKSGDTSINTGSPEVDNAITVCLSNPSFVGGVFAFVLDNLVPGSLRERGIPEPDADLRSDKETKGNKYNVLLEESKNKFADKESYHKYGADATSADVCDDIRILVDEKDNNKLDDRYDVGVEVYRIKWIPNFLRDGMFSRIFPIFDKRL